MEWLHQIAGIAGDVCAVGACAALLCRPIRERVLGLGKIQTGAKCLLRAEITHTYYSNLSTKTLREHEFQNLMCCYEAYAALHGNTFVSKIVAEMQEWEIIP